MSFVQFRDLYKFNLYVFYQLTINDVFTINQNFIILIFTTQYTFFQLFLYNFSHNCSLISLAIQLNLFNFNFHMLQNQSVRHRLKNQLNVQLADSNIIDNNAENLMESRIQKNDGDSVSEMSIIHQLGILDNIESIHWKNDSNDYIFRNHTLLNDNVEHYIHGQRHFQQNSSPFPALRNKIKSFRQDLQSQNDYRNDQRIYENRHLGKEVKTPPKNKNIFSLQKTKNVMKSQKEHNQIADIESKISILPFQLQQKIKENLHKKMTNFSKDQQYIQTSPTKQNDLFIVDFHKEDHIDENFIQNSSNLLNFPEDSQPQGYFTNRQKFVSVNRQALSSPTNISIIVRQQPLMQNPKSTNQINPPLQRREQSVSRFRNSIDLKQTFSIHRKNHSKSRDKEKKSKNHHNIKTNQMILKRKTQFEQYYNNQLGSKNAEKGIFKNQSIQELSEQFNKSKIIKFFSQIMNSLPKCKKCSTSYGALTLWKGVVTFSCNQCDLKNKEQRSISFLSSSSGDDLFLGFNNQLEKQAINYNHPVIGALFDIENKLTNQTQMKTYNNLIKEITFELQKLQETKKKLTKLHSAVQELKTKVRTNPKSIFEAKTALKKIFTPQFTSNNSLQYWNQEEKLQSIDKIIPPTYLEELDIWCKLKAQNFTSWPSIDQKLEILCPLYMKRNIKTIREFLDPLLHNFQHNDIKISVSEGLKLPVKSLTSATFIVDGAYNISPFDHIERLSMEFLNKRTFRQITSMMENFPQTVEQLKVTYNHKLNSHISAQKYPLLTKICSFRSTKKLNAIILNCKDEDDLISSMKVMTKKKQLSITTTRSIYVRKPLTEATNEIKQMIKRLGKNNNFCELNLPVIFNEHSIYRQLILTQRNKLMHFSLKSSLINESQMQFRKEKQEDEDFISGFSIINGVQKTESRMMNSTVWFENEPKRIFEQKMRKKLSVLALLKDSFKEREAIEKYKENQCINVQKLSKKHKVNHSVRLQVLKMFL